MGAAEELGGRGRLARVVGGLALVLIALLVAVAPVPAYVLRPGPLFSLTEVMSVDGRSADDLAGDVVFTTIAAEDATTFDLLRAAVDPDLTAVSQSSLVPPGVDEDTFVAQQQARFRESEDLAGQAVAALLGVGDVAIEVDTDVVGGPSAGLLIAVAAYDLLDDADVTAGRVVSGTGEITADGTVEGVGSVALKLQAAVAGGVEVFLVPSGQAAQARAALPADATMAVVGVDSLAEAVEALVDG